MPAKTANRDRSPRMLSPFSAIQENQKSSLNARPQRVRKVNMTEARLVALGMDTDEESVVSIEPPSRKRKKEQKETKSRLLEHKSNGFKKPAMKTVFETNGTLKKKTKKTSSPKAPPDGEAALEISFLESYRSEEIPLVKTDGTSRKPEEVTNHTNRPTNKQKVNGVHRSPEPPTSPTPSKIHNTRRKARGVQENVLDQNFMRPSVITYGGAKNKGAKPERPLPDETCSVDTNGYVSSPEKGRKRGRKIHKHTQQNGKQLPSEVSLSPGKLDHILGTKKPNVNDSSKIPRRPLELKNVAKKPSPRSGEDEIELVLNPRSAQELVQPMKDLRTTAPKKPKPQPPKLQTLEARKNAESVSDPIPRRAAKKAKEEDDFEDDNDLGEMDSFEFKISQKREKQKAQPVEVKSTLKEYFDGNHCLIAPGSNRLVANADVQDLNDVLPTVIPEESLINLLAAHDVFRTLFNFAQGRAKAIRTAKLFLRRNLRYNVDHRRFGEPKHAKVRTKEDKIRDLNCLCKHLIQGKTPSSRSRKAYSQTYPVDLGVKSLTLKKPETVAEGCKIDLQFTVIRRDPSTQLTRERITVAMAGVPKVHGRTQYGSVKCIVPKELTRVPSWDPRDFFLVTIRLPGSTSARTLAFHISEIKPATPLEIPNNCSFILNVRYPSLQRYEKVDYKNVILYPPGENHHAKEMAIVKDPLKGHSCLFCGIQCDSLCSLLRHFEGMHPGIGYEFDPNEQRLYLWVSPDKEFVRSVPGLVDHWEMINFGTRKNGTRIARKERDPLHCKFPNSQQVLQWVSRRYRPEMLDDVMPNFDLHRLLKVYGVPVKPVRHFLHTDAVRNVRPDYCNIYHYDSDEDTEWQDEYEKEKIHDFIDCSLPEKHLMCLWNAFTRKLSPIFTIGMADILGRFAVEHAMEIEMLEAFPAFCAMLSVMRMENVICQQDVVTILSSYRRVVDCQPGQSGRN